MYRNETGAGVHRALLETAMTTSNALLRAAAPIAMALGLLAGAPAQALTTDIGAASEEEVATIHYGELGPWSLYIDPTLSNGCFMFAEYVGGRGLRLGFDPTIGAVHVMFVSEGWRSIDDGGEYEGLVRFGDAEPWEVTFMGVDLEGPKGLVASFDEAELFDEFAVSKDVVVEYQDARILELKLQDPAAALKELKACQAAQPPVNRDPFAKK
jgi:hypothetical protein